MTESPAAPAVGCKHKFLTLRYHCVLTVHDGYCSDPCDLETTEREEVLRIHDPAFDAFENGPVPLTEPLLARYLTLNVGCSMGSGYCGLGLERDLISAAVSPGESFAMLDMIRFSTHDPLSVIEIQSESEHSRWPE